MHINTLKEAIHELIDQIEDEELLVSIFKIIYSITENNGLRGMNENEKKLVDQGIHDLNNCESAPHEDVLKEVNQILKGI